MTKVQSKQIEHRGQSLEEILDGVKDQGLEKIILEQVQMGGNYIKDEPSQIIECPEIQKHLEDGWSIQKLF